MLRFGQFMSNNLIFKPFLYLLYRPQSLLGYGIIFEGGQEVHNVIHYHFVHVGFRVEQIEPAKLTVYQ